MESCNLCRFFKAHMTAGVCRVNANTFIGIGRRGEGVAGQPVENNWWCGQFEPVAEEAEVDQTGTGEETIVPAAVGEAIRVYGLTLTAVGSIVGTFTDGLVLSLSPAIHIPYSPRPLFSLPAGDALVLTLGSELVRVTGQVIYARF